MIQLGGIKWVKLPKRCPLCRTVDSVLNGGWNAQYFCTKCKCIIDARSGRVFDKNMNEKRALRLTEREE